MDEYIAYMRGHPPRCAAACRPASPDMTGLIQADLGPMSTAFEVGGGRCLPVWGTPAPGGPPGMYTGPVLVGSNDPPTAVFVFDEYRDGYDGEFGHLGPPPERRTEQVRCRSCGATEFRVVVGFQYTGHNEELDESTLIARRQDFFGWFRLVGMCCACGASSVVADVECA